MMNMCGKAPLVGSSSIQVDKYLMNSHCGPTPTRDSLCLPSGTTLSDET